MNYTFSCILFSCLFKADSFYGSFFVINCSEMGINIMIIKNGIVFMQDGAFHRQNIYTNGKLITASDEVHDRKIIDAEGLYVLPGLVDIHTHGAVGHDFCDGDAKGLKEIAEYEKSCGITSFCPTSMTFSESRLSGIFETINYLQPSDNLARVAGINMEGPFISSSKKGAQNKKYIQNPDIEMFAKLNEKCNNRIRIITIAPELEGSMDFIRKYHDKVTISLGHSDASYETALEAINAGATHITHLFNAMPPYNHRNPGIVGAAIDNNDIMVEIICDGVHIHPSVIKTVFKLFGDKRVILISDSMEATGMPDGEYGLGGQRVYKNGSYATLSDGTIAGSVTNLFNCMKNAINYGIPPESAIKAATCNPAKSIGLSGKIGTLAENAYADIILVDKNFELVRII